MQTCQMYLKTNVNVIMQFPFLLSQARDDLIMWSHTAIIFFVSYADSTVLRNKH